jgi:hypothetical protein
MRKHTPLVLDNAKNYKTRYNLTVTAPRPKRRMNVEAMPAWIQWLHATWIAGAFRSLVTNIRYSRKTGKHGYSRARAIRNKIATAFLILTMAFGGVIASTGAANAGGLEGRDIAMAWCKGTSFLGGAPATQPLGFALPKPESGPMTGAEKFGFFLETSRYIGWYGTDEAPKELNDLGYKDDKNAAYAKSNPAGCLQGDVSTNALMTFTAQKISSISGAVAAQVVGVAFGEDTVLIKGIKAKVSEIVTGRDFENKDIVIGPGLVNSLYLEWIGPVIMFGALYMAYVGLIKRRSTEAMTSAIWMVSSTILGFFFLLSPFTMLDGVGNAGAAVTNGFMTGINKPVMDMADSSTNLCYVDPKVGTEKSRLVRTTQCIIWYRFSYIPYVESQVGTNGEQDRNKDQIPHEIDLGAGVNASPKNWALYQLDQQWKNANDDQAAIDAKNKAKILLVKTQVGDPSANKPGAGAVNRIWTGSDIAGVAPVNIAAVAATAFAFVIVFFGGGVLIRIFTTIALIAVAPLFCLIGVHPGFGRRVAMKYLETLLSYQLQIMMYGIMTAVSVLFFSIIMTLEIPAFWVAGGCVVVAIAIIKSRETFTNMFATKINLGGGGPVNVHGQAAGMVQEGAKRGAAILSGAGMGGAAAILTNRKNAKNVREVMSAAVASAGTQRATVPAGLAGEGLGGATPATEKNSSSKATVRRTPAIPDAQGFGPGSSSSSKGAGSPVVSGFPVLSGKQSSAVKGANAGNLDKATAAIILKKQRGDLGPKHRAESTRAGVATPSFRKDTPEAPKPKSGVAVFAAGASKGAFQAARSGSTSISGGMNAGLEAGRGVAETASQEHATALRELEKETKAAERAERDRLAEQRKAAAAERKAKEDARKAQEKENPMSGALPRKSTSAPQGLPVKQMGLPARTNSIAGATGRRAATR